MDTTLAKALVDEGLITSDQLEKALELRGDSDRYIGTVLVENGYIREEVLLRALSDRFGIPVVEIDGKEVDGAAVERIPVHIVQKHKCMPLANSNGHLTLAVSNPAATEAVDEARFASGRPIRTVLCSESSILHAIEKHYDVTVESILSNLTPDDDEEAGAEEYFIHDLKEKASEPTLINLVNVIISQAIQDGASDIHVELFEDEMRVKYRVDGILHEIQPPPKKLQPAIVSRIKIMAGMDIAKRHVPQDGHIRINLPDAQVDIRVATVPTVFGECVVMRLLNKSAALIGLDNLGLGEANYEKFRSLLTLSHGIVLVTGPTGSGKSTSLYAALNEIYTPEKKIITIEDPVEYQLTGVNQIPVRPARGVTFAAGLRAVLRLDPDILMVGEVRDLETAEIAIRSALTGHLIFSTLHTNDAPSAVTRLIDMGVESYLIASSLMGVLAQRLVRRLCAKCREPFTPSDTLLEQFGRKPSDVEGITFYRAVGCEFCRGRGYDGRVGIFEMLMITEELRNLILSSRSSQAIKETALESMTTMREDGWEKICRGVTTFEEVLRQTQRDIVENGDAPDEG